MDERVRAAIAASHLRGLPREVLTELLVGARSVRAAEGRTMHRVGEGERHVELVVQGLVRVHASAPDGRTLTIRYCREGALIGVLSLYAEPFVMPVTTQAVVASELLAIRPTVLRRLADEDLRVARVLLIELSERAAAFAGEIGGSTFSRNFLGFPRDAATVADAVAATLDGRGCRTTSIRRGALAALPGTAS